MINLISDEDVFKYEPHLRRYLRGDQLSFEGIINHSYDEFLQMLRDKNLETKKLMTALSVTTSESDKDLIERRLFNIKVTDLTSEAVFTLYGSNDLETWTEIGNYAIGEIGNHKFIINDVYYYYKIEVSGTVTYKSYLYETSFYFTQLFLSLSNIYNSLRALGNDLYENKQMEYRTKFEEYFAKVVFSYDTDLDGSIQDSETNQVKTVNIYR